MSDIKMDNSTRYEKKRAQSDKALENAKVI